MHILRNYENNQLVVAMVMMGHDNSYRRPQT